MKQKLFRMIGTALFAAIAFLSLFIFKIHGIGGFLSFDIKDAILTISGLFFGPFYGLLSALLVTLLEFLTISSTGIWGLVMNFLSSAVFVLIASLLYGKKPSLARAIVALGSASLSMTAVMLVLNLFITPIYMHVTVDAVIALIPGTILPFNLIKAICNSAIIMLLYKPLSNSLKKAHLQPGGKSEDRPIASFSKKSLIIMLSAVAVIAICFIIFIFVFHGSF